MSQALCEILGKTTGSLAHNGFSFHGVYNLANKFKHEIIVEIVCKMYCEAHNRVLMVKQGTCLQKEIF